MDKVCAFTKKIIIPTYKVGKPEKNPLFLEKRVYQGSSGSVYPHPVIEKIAHEKTDKEYLAVFIENKYLQIVILPELGGRVYRAFDKIRQRDFVYYNQVIKPALVGLTGPWVSGGIEFNWPQHHRPSTFDAVDYSIVENEDGSQTVWVNEVELMSRTKGMAGFTLYPDKAYLEIKGKIFNRSPFPQTFLWWANPAVKVNDDYQSVFPPDVNAVYDHGKRDVSSFPVATGTYYKVDYSPGTDISRYSNIPVPTSFMAVESEYNFLGCYENDTQAGMLHVADHHFSPGKKQWTWGNGNFGKAWDKNLTDEDGPYIELMCGVYTDNQPDFTWLQPNEEKTFEQYFFPYSNIGVVKNASKEAAINVHIENNSAEIYVYVTSVFENAVIRGSAGKENIYEETVSLSPENSFYQKIETGNEELSVEIYDQHGKLLISYNNDPIPEKEIPLPATPMTDPVATPTTELLFLYGLHLEQYRHATYRPEDYYQEAIRRDSGDIRNNNAMGLWLMRHGQPEKAEAYFRTAIKSITTRNPNPYDGEPYYNLGMSLSMQQNFDAAYNYFYKSAWNDALQHSAYLQLARIAARRKDFAQALYLIEKSLIKNWHSHSARHLKTTLLRKLQKAEQSVSFAKESLELDPFNYGCLFELNIQKKISGSITESIRSFNNYAEYALDYAAADFYEEAFDLMSLYHGDDSLFFYYLGWFKALSSAPDAADYFNEGYNARPDFCFPSKYEEVQMLKMAVALNPKDYKAFYYLGNYWYANRNYAEAIVCWEKSIAINDQFPTPYRNLALAYHNKLHQSDKALRSLEKAFELDTSDARVLMELDQLYKILNHHPAERLQLLEKNISLVEERNDLYLERITLYNILGDYKKAAELISKEIFQPWEGGEGKVVLQFIISHTELAREAILQNNPAPALDHLNKLDEYPDNLGEGKLPGTRDNDIDFWKGTAAEKSGDHQQAELYFSRATKGTSVPQQAIFYNDPQPDKIFYQGKAHQKLNRDDKAKEIFEGLIQYGNDHMNDKVRIDYFAVSLPDLLVFDQDLDLKNKIHCHYVTGLGYLGLGNKELATWHLNEVLKMNINHQGALTHINRTDL